MGGGKLQDFVIAFARGRLGPFLSLSHPFTATGGHANSPCAPTSVATLILKWRHRKGFESCR